MMNNHKNARQKISETELKKKLRIEQLLSELALSLFDIHPSQIGNTIEKSLKDVAKFVAADRAYVYLIDNENRDFVRTHHFNQRGVRQKRRRYKNISHADFNRIISVLRAGKSIKIEQPNKLTSNAAKIHLLTDTENIKSAIFYPLIDGDKVTGYFGLDSVTGKIEFEPYIEQLIIKAARIFAAALNYKQKSQSGIQLEQKFKNLFSEIEDVVFISSPEGNFLEVNAAGAKLFGYGSVDELKNINIDRDLYFNSADRDKLKRALKMRGHLKNFELNLKRKDGEKVVVMETATVIKNEHGEIIAYQGILHDVTHQRKLEQQLALAQKLESVGLLAGGVAHDFNNILTTINGYAELIRMDVDTDNPHYENINSIIDGVKRAEKLIHSLLAFSRKQMIIPHIIDLNKVIRDLRSMIISLIGENIRLDLRLKDNINRVKADISQIQQIIVNLVLNSSNAIKEKKDSSQKGLIRILTDDIETRKDFAEGDGSNCETKCVRIIVEDNGVGMNKETQQKIFEPFFSTNRTGPGSGLGLSTVYGIVKQNNGFIRVESELDIGTVVEVYWPATEEKYAHEIPPEAVIQSKPADEIILYVEDDIHVRDLVSTALKSFGYKVIAAENGEKALDKVISNEMIHKIDLLISDIVMPDMGGQELADIIHKLNPKIKIILCSGYTDSQVTADQKFTENEYLFLAKPFSIKKLEKTIRLALT